MECYVKRTLPPGTFVLCTRDFDLQEATGRPVVLSVNNGSAIIREFDVDGDSLRLTPWNNSYEIIKEKKTKVKIYGRVLKCILNFEDQPFPMTQKKKERYKTALPVLDSLCDICNDCHQHKRPEDIQTRI